MNKLPKQMKGLTNLKNANSQQLDWLLKWKCQHRHNGVRHFNCFSEEVDDYGLRNVDLYYLEDDVLQDRLTNTYL